MKTDRAVLLLKMMANPIRLRILKILATKENGVCVGGIEDILKIPQPSVSQHLAHLRNSDILRCQKNGKKVCYQITDESIRKMLNSLEIDDFNFDFECIEGDEQDGTK